MNHELFDTDDNVLSELPSQQLVRLHPDWRAALDTQAARDALIHVDGFLQKRLAAGAAIYPKHVFRALESLTPQDVRVVILGQDPYHGRGQAQGLAFSVPDTCRTPPSLRNMFKELARDYPDQPLRQRNELSDWSRQGVLLLNTSLTVEDGIAGSHSRIGWEVITDAVIDAVARSPRPKVFMLWGAHAQSMQARIETTARDFLVLSANHPSPLSASRPPRPFLGCGHFSAANAWLAAKGEPEINWFSVP